MTAPLQVLCISEAPPPQPGPSYGPFAWIHCPDLAAAAAELTHRACDAVLVALDGPDAVPALSGWTALSHAVLDSAVVVVVPGADAATAVELLQRGVQDVLPPGEPETIARALRLAVERKRLERAARKAYATDLATGLPNHAQLLEHMTHLVALRAREPAPMALIVLRIEGLGAVASLLGVESANVLRRKVAVRLRSALRASDVVASIGVDTFAVLLAWIDAADDGERVAAKLARLLSQPFSVAGRTQSVRVGAGLASFPEHGDRAEMLLRRALGQAASVATVGNGAFAHAADRGPDAAANDEG